MSPHGEKLIIQASLINAALFYALVIVLFLIARKDRLNKALATQKAFWFCLVTSTFALITWGFMLPQVLRVILWLGLSGATWWVFVEVFLVNRLIVREWLRHRAGQSAAWGQRCGQCFHHWFEAHRPW